MHSNHNVHLPKQNIKCSTVVALYNGVTYFQRGIDGEEIYAKSVTFSVFCHNVVTDMLKVKENEL